MWNNIGKNNSENLERKIDIDFVEKVEEIQLSAERDDTGINTKVSEATTKCEVR